MNLKCIATLCVAAFATQQVSAEPLPRLETRRAQRRFAEACADAERLSRAVRALNLAHANAQDRRTIAACYRAHKMLWEDDAFGVRVRIAAAAADPQVDDAAIADLTILRGFAACASASAYLLKDDDAFAARAREAIAYYGTLEGVEPMWSEQYTARSEAESLALDLADREASAPESEEALELADAPEPTLPPVAEAPIPARSPEGPRAHVATLRMEIATALTDLAAARTEECYGRFAALAEEEHLDAKLEEIAVGDRNTLTVEEREVLLGRAKCAHGTLEAIADATAQNDRTLDAAKHYDAYAQVERRPERAEAVRAATAAADALYVTYYAFVERRAMEAHPQPEHAEEPTERVPVVDAVAETPRASFLKRLGAANAFLRLKMFRRSYRTFRHLAQEELGKSHPDVAFGLAQSAELSCAAIDDDGARLERLGEALGEYTRYLRLETRVEHLRGPNARGPEVERTLRELVRRIAELEARIAEAARAAEADQRAAEDAALLAARDVDASDLAPAEPAVPTAAIPVSVSASAVDPAEGAHAPPAPDPLADDANGRSVAPAPAPAPADNAAERAARAAVERRDPALAQLVAQQPGYTWAQIWCFLEHGMAPRTLTAVSDRIRFVYNLPPPDAVCPPEEEG